MQPTKYPLEPSVVPSGRISAGLCSSVDLWGDCAPSGGACVSVPPTGGREAPLDLIEEHLTYDSLNSEYRQGVHGGHLIKNWYFPDDWRGASSSETYVLKIQPFAKGGYEATVRSVDLERIGDAIVNGGKRGKREAPDVVSYENQQKAASRSKRKMRHLVKNMMADHMVTFTKREVEGAVYWSAEQWAVAWDKFRRLLTRVIGDFPYVAILEKHEKGNFHLHVAWCGRVQVGLVRKLWLLALGTGKGSGNIDAKHFKVPYGGDRSSRIARYISKYVSKHFEADLRYNKKRYWASRQTLEEARRYVLTADTLDGAVDQMRRMLGLDFSKFTAVRHGRLVIDNFFTFPDGGGVWLNYVPELHSVDPPF